MNRNHFSTTLQSLFCHELSSVRCDLHDRDVIFCCFEQGPRKILNVSPQVNIFDLSQCGNPGVQFGFLFGYVCRSTMRLGSYCLLLPSALAFTKPLFDSMFLHARSLQPPGQIHRICHLPRSQLGYLIFFFNFNHSISLSVVVLSYCQKHGSAMYLPNISKRPNTRSQASTSQIISCSHFPSLLGSKSFQTECMSSGSLFVTIQVDYAVP